MVVAFLVAVVVTFLVAVVVAFLVAVVVAFLLVTMVFVLVAMVVVFVLVTVVVFALFLILVGVVLALVLVVALVLLVVIVLSMCQTLGEGPQVHVMGQLQDCALCAVLKVLLHRRQSGSHDHQQIRFRRLADVARGEGEGVGIRPGGNDALDRDPVTANLLHQVLDDRCRSHNREGGVVAAAALLVVPAGDDRKRDPREQSGEHKVEPLRAQQSHRSLRC